MANLVTVQEILREQKENLKLEIIAGRSYLHRAVTVSEVNRPGLALSGFLEHFRAERVQIIGRGEHAYCIGANQKRLSAILLKMLANPELPCLVITRNSSIPAPLKAACERRRVPLLRSALDTATFVGELTAYLEDRLAPSTTLHGVLVDIYGLGVLIMGEAGIGKSECALELLKRGHILVADDVIEIRQKRGGTLWGSCPAPLKYFMEVRGLGVLNVRMLFGIGSVLDRSRVELAVTLEVWDPNRPFDRTGLEEKTLRLLDVEIPLVKMPVSPGRNLAILIEVAALNRRLKSHGYYAAQAFNEKLMARIRNKEP
jgi:HPr kinase/phosphorylase